MSILVATTLLAASLPANMSQGGAPPIVYAFVVANNQSLSQVRAPLRFADDDGARWTELFELYGDRVELFTVMDADTQSLYPSLIDRARVPNRNTILEALTKTFAAIRRDVDAGREVAFYFVYSGHGEVSGDGEGFVHLLDERWTRADLFEHVVAASPATVNHLIIDACNAYFLVAQRGAQAEAVGDYSSLIRDFVGRERLERYPNTGVILSTASANEVHEWGRIEAGIFSHELRSALAGAGDATGDGYIDYHEAAAYLAAANGGLPDRKMRLQIYARPPARNLDEPLLQIDNSGARLTVPATWTGRYYLEDDRGVRFADFHKSEEIDVRLSLVPRERYYLRGGDREFLIEPATPWSETIVAALEPQPLVLAARGASHDAFDRHLFAIPFGPGFYRGHRQAALAAPEPTAMRVVEVEVEVERPLRPWIYTTAALGGALAITSGVMTGLAYATANDYRNLAGSNAEVEALHGRAQDYQNAAIATGSVAATSAVAALVLYWLED